MTGYPQIVQCIGEDGETVRPEAPDDLDDRKSEVQEKGETNITIGGVVVMVVGHG